jgi:CheY-like chemotaxis protein
LTLCGRRILVVEDEALVALDLTAMIATAGGTTIGPFGRIGEALTALPLSAIDAAIVDLKLAGDRSTAVLEALDKAAVPFVICSGYGTISLPPAFASRPFIAKPFLIPEVLAVLQRVLPRPTPPLGGVLHRALAAMRVDRGNIQLLEANALRIVAHEGFGRPFLEFFSVVRDGESACGQALREAQRVYFEDVQIDPAFTGTDFRTVMLDAGARSVCSTPIVVGGRVCGMLSIHRPLPWQPTRDELGTMDRCARDAAAVLSGEAQP